VPQGYFESSKKDMLNFKFEKVSKMSSFFGSKTILTASILGVITFAFLLVQKQQLSNYEINIFEELTIESLEVNDEVFDDWFDEKFVYSEVY
jgi:hypothetical protein